MTPDQIRSLSPGPELDRAVCEIIMEVKNPARPPAYSTTWAGLGLVVEEMERRGWYTGGGREIVPPDFPGQHMIGFGKPPGDPGELLGQAVSAPTYMEAACKAALLALAAEKGQGA